MNLAKTLLLPLMLSLCMAATARQVTDTLMSAQQDMVVLTYDVVQKDGMVKIIFKDINKKKLGRANKTKYGDLTDVKIMFFDRIGSFQDVYFSGMDPAVFMVPSELDYERSEDGYFLLGDNPEVVFKGTPKTGTVISIPMYLVHYEKKDHYKIFAQCGPLKVKLGNAIQQIQPQGPHNPQSTFIELEVGGELSEDEANVLASANYILDELQNAKGLPFSETLVTEVEGLKKLKYKMQNPEIVARIDQALNAFEEKKKELEEKAAADAAAAQIEAQRQDSIARAEALQKEQEEKAAAEEKEQQQRKRNIWMIIGGALLAILLFTGNQILQSYRNKKTQRSMMQMQQNAVKQAQNTARRKVESEIRAKTSGALNQTKGKGKGLVRNGINNIKPGKTIGKNKKISI